MVRGNLPGAGSSTEHACALLRFRADHGVPLGPAARPDHHGVHGDLRDQRPVQPFAGLGVGRQRAGGPSRVHRGGMVREEGRARAQRHLLGGLRCALDVPSAAGGPAGPVRRQPAGRTGGALGRLGERVRDGVVVGHPTGQPLAGRGRRLHPCLRLHPGGPGVLPTAGRAARKPARCPDLRVHVEQRADGHRPGGGAQETVEGAVLGLDDAGGALRSPDADHERRAAAAGAHPAHRALQRARLAAGQRRGRGDHDHRRAERAVRRWSRGGLGAVGAAEIQRPHRADEPRGRRCCCRTGR